jgi:hypothetical protein
MNTWTYVGGHPSLGCNDDSPGVLNSNPDVEYSDPSMCEYNCADTGACNYNVGCGSTYTCTSDHTQYCEYSSCSGCMDSTYCEYDHFATIDAPSMCINPYRSAATLLISEYAEGSETVVSGTTGVNTVYSQ